MSVKLVNVKGKPYHRLYLCERAYLGNNRVKKLQVNLLFKDEHEAKREEEKWKKKLIKEAAKFEGKGLDFKDLVKRFQRYAENGFMDRKIEPQTLKDHINRVNKFCDSWINRPVSELSKCDGRAVLKLARSQKASLALQKKIKASINLIFNWGIEERLVEGVAHSPVYGLYLESDNNEKIPPILSLEQVKLLLQEAKKQDHPWYNIWAFAILTGMRSGELYALRWSSVSIKERIIRVSDSYLWRQKRIKSTKAKYWRNVPISDSLLNLIQEIKIKTSKSEYVLPRADGWNRGQAAKHLRMFLRKLGIDEPVVFHTLRACFATHLLASGVEPAKVMLIGGWKDLKTFQIYIRLAGIDVAGVTNNFNVLPDERVIANKVGKIYELNLL